MSKPTRPPSHPTDRLQRALRYRWPAVPLFLGVAVAAVAGLLIPVSPAGTDTDHATRSILAANAPDAPPAEDLTGFLAIDRWGAPAVEEDPEPVEEPQEPAELNPALQGIGFVGVTFMEDEYAVLLNLAAASRNRWQVADPDLQTGMVRLVGGDTLPDGRELVSIAADSVTLVLPNAEHERLLLFGDWDETAD